MDTMTKEFIVKAMRYLNGEKLKQLYIQYQGGDNPVRTTKSRNILTGSAINFLKDVVTNGGTDEEIEKVMEYIAICIQSQKYGITVEKYAKDNGILELRKKYQPWLIKHADTKSEG